MESPAALVVDACVAIKLFLKETDSDRARSLFALLEDHPPAVFHAPDLLYAECANIIWKTMSRCDFSIIDAKRDILNLLALPIQSTASFDLAEAALDIAHTHNIAAYDACYVALASRLNVPLITADQKLVAALASTSLPVTLLRDFPVSAPQ